KGQANPREALSGRRLGEYLSAEQRAQILPFADYRHGDIRKPDVAGVNLGTSGGAATRLGGLVAACAGLFLMGAEPMNQIAKLRARAGRGASRSACSRGPELYQRIFCFYARVMPGVR